MATAKQVQGSVSYHAGLSAEWRVAQDYQRRGFTLVRERWRGTRGEIDLVLSNGATLVFVEVKKSNSFQRAAQRVTHRQMRRIYGAAEEFLATQPSGMLSESRFDVALVDQVGDFQILENAFGHD